MKIIYYLRLMTASLALLLLGVACEDSSSIEVSQAESLTLSLSGVTDTNIMVDVSIDGIDKYFVGLIETSEVGSDLSLETATLMSSMSGLIYSLTDNRYLFNKDMLINLSSGWSIEPETSYTVVSCGVDRTGLITTDVQWLNVTTSSASSQNSDQGSVSVDIYQSTNSTIIVDVTPDSSVEQYFVGAYSLSLFEQNYNSDFGALAEDQLTDLGSESIYSDSQRIDLSLYYDFEGNSDYVVYAAVILSDGTIGNFDGVITSTISEGASGVSLPRIDLDIEVAMGDQIIVKATPLNGAGNYFVGACTKEQFTSIYSSDIDALAEALSSGVDLTQCNYTSIFEGEASIDISTIIDTEIVAQNTYIVMAAVVESDGELGDTEAMFVTPLVDPNELPVISVKVVEQTLKDIIIDVDPGEYKGNWYLGQIAKADFDKVYEGDYQAYADYMMVYELSQSTTNLTMIDDIYIFSGAHQNISVNNAWLCYPGTEYVIAIFGIEGYDGNIVTEVTYLESSTLYPEMNYDFLIDISASDFGAYGSAVLTYLPNQPDQRYCFACYSSFAFGSSFTVDNMSLLYTLVQSNPTNIAKGNMSIQYEGLTNGSNYIAIGFAVDDDDIPCSNMSYVEFQVVASSSSPAKIGERATNQTTMFDRVMTPVYGGVYPFGDKLFTPQRAK